MTMVNSTKAKEMAIKITIGETELEAILGLPSELKGVVLFAHGSGSGRFSPRNNFVARVLQDSGIATLLADLLEESEASDRSKVFDIGLLAERLLANAKYIRNRADTKGLPLGYFGASTGAAAALQAAAREPERVGAVVSRGGRPDLAFSELPLVHAPTLLIIGGEDTPVIPLNRSAFDQLRCEKNMVIVPGATHLFEEPGALEKVAELARDWFLKYFA